MSKIKSVAFSNSALWEPDRSDVTVTVALELEGQTASVSLKVRNGAGQEATIGDPAEFSGQAVRKYTVGNALLSLGENLITVRALPEGQAQPLTYIGAVTVENRDSFQIKRKLAYENEFFVSGQAQVKDVGASLTSDDTFKQSLILPKKFIYMDGRDKIAAVAIDGDADSLKTVTVTEYASYRSDKGDCIVQKIPLRSVQSFAEISKIQLVNT